MYRDLWKEFEKSGDIQSYLKYRSAFAASTETAPERREQDESSAAVRTESRSFVIEKSGD